MFVRHRLVLAGALALGSLAASAPAAGASPQGEGTGPSFASFEGTVIDLREGWGEATACVSDGVSTECFRTEAELDAVLGGAEEPVSAVGAAAASGGPVALALSCGGQLRLWSGNSYSGSVLAFTTRGVILNLSSYGFDNVTSSYAVGPCSSTFYAGANGGGGTYPGSTSAGSSSAVMVSGWNNVVSSIYIS